MGRGKKNQENKTWEVTSLPQVALPKEVTMDTRVARVAPGQLLGAPAPGHGVASRMKEHSPTVGDGGVQIEASLEVRYSVPHRKPRPTSHISRLSGHGLGDLVSSFFLLFLFLPSLAAPSAKAMP
jgi:hypothetical protein